MPGAETGARILQHFSNVSMAAARQCMAKRSPAGTAAWCRSAAIAAAASFIWPVLVIVACRRPYDEGFHEQSATEAAIWQHMLPLLHRL
jgi:hypothetical protein